MANVARLEYEKYFTRMRLRTAARSDIPSESVLNCDQGDIIIVFWEKKKAGIPNHIYSGASMDTE